MKKKGKRNKGIIKELWSFIIANKNWWLLPLIILLLLTTLLIILGTSSPVSPFIYPLI